MPSIAEASESSSAITASSSDTRARTGWRRSRSTGRPEQLLWWIRSSRTTQPSWVTVGRAETFRLRFSTNGRSARS